MLARLISACRFLLVIPVLCCLVMTGGIVVVGVVEVYEGMQGIFLEGEYSVKLVAVGAIEVIDLFLIATVSYITALGIFKLFITNEDIQILRSIKIDTLQDLEDKILGVVIAALAVAFLGQAASGDEAAALLDYGGGIALVIAALAWFMRKNDSGSRG